MVSLHDEPFVMTEMIGHAAVVTVVVGVRGEGGVPEIVLVAYLETFDVENAGNHLRGLAGPGDDHSSQLQIAHRHLDGDPVGCVRGQVIQCERGDRITTINGRFLRTGRRHR